MASDSGFLKNVSKKKSSVVSKRMPLVEGVGDEVTQFFFVLVIVLLGLAAWWSTQIADTPLVRTVLILERRTRQRGSGERHRSRQRITLDETANSVQIVNAEETVETDTGQSEEGAEVAEAGSSDETKTESASQQSSQDEAPQEQQQQQESSNETTPLAPEDETCQLRQRRLVFLENMANTNTTGEEAADTQDGQGSIRIRLKYLNDEQKLVQGQLHEPLGDFRKRHFSLELEANKLVRLIFNGQVLARDGASLEEHGLFDNCVVHCLVHQPRNNTDTPQSNPTPTPQRERQQGGEGREWDLGSVVFMFLSITLGMAWYGRCVYSQYFTTTASVALVGLTGVFVVSVVGLMLPDQDGVRQ